jgi:hypothetical protein
MCAQVDSLGQILDLRNKTNCPSLKNVSKWSSAKIKELCIAAFERQMAELEEVEGAENKQMRALKSELRTVRRLDTFASPSSFTSQAFCVHYVHSAGCLTVFTGRRSFFFCMGSHICVLFCAMQIKAIDTSAADRQAIKYEF